MAVPDLELKRRMEAFASACRRKGLKATHQRMEVFAELAASDEHPDAETLYQRVRERVPAISRDTVYRTLATLERKGFIRRADAVTGASRYDANPRPHHHFICTSCGLIKDFRSEALDDLSIPKSVEALGRIDTAQVQVRGVCKSCQKKAKRDK